jgi:hypothetical protein
MRPLSIKHSYNLHKKICKFQYLHVAFLYGSFPQQLCFLPSVIQSVTAYYIQ